MKKLLSVLAATCALVASPLPAQTETPQFQSIKMHATVMPTFPATLVARGITTGTVRVAVRVGADGRLEDWIVVGYTEEILATAAVDALKRWRFTPAQWEGEPVTAQSEIVFTFRLEGVVVNQHLVEHFLDRFSRIGTELSYRPSTLRELDRIPTPVQVVSPHYGQGLVDQGIRGEVTVDFYIDEQGRVRMPVVGREEDPRLAALALEAVRQWTFEPPTRRGKPVLVQARQRFRFAPEE